MNDHRLPSVRLRAIEPEDLDILYRIENDMQLWGVGSTNVPYSRYTLHDYIARSSGDIYADRQVRLVIENTDGQVLGLADLVSFDPRHLRAEVGIVIEKPFRHSGYAQAALAALHHYARSILHLHQLYAIVDEANSPAQSLFRSTGYTCSATLADWLYNGNSYANAQLWQLTLL